MSKVVWSTLASSTDESRVLKQHGFVELSEKENPFGEYIGNRSLCGRSYVMEDDRVVSINEIGPEKRSIHACKICAKIFDKYGKE